MHRYDHRSRSLSQLLAWYFSLEPRAFLTVPVAIWLLSATVVSLVGSTAIWLDSAKAASAVGGLIGAVVSLTLLSAVYFLPPAIYWLCFVDIPRLWQSPSLSGRRKSLRTLSHVLAATICAYLAGQAGSQLAAWIADREPHAALAAGWSGDTGLLASNGG